VVVGRRVEIIMGRGRERDGGGGWVRKCRDMLRHRLATTQSR